jgi:pyruvate formate lyase activating enzyme
MQGLIFSIKRYAVHDGPGIRVVFFMKGCPLSCRWCHNPEGISPESEEVIQSNRVGENEFQEKSTVGRLIGVPEVLSVLEKERVFIEKSGGGVTFSGGEPLMQPDFLEEALRACREKGFHTAVDTAGHYPSALLFKIVPLTDLFLFDLKHPDSGNHQKYTGVSNEQILENLRLLTDSGKNVMIRIPVIPGINDDDDTVEKFKNIITRGSSEKIKMINLLPYHRIGSSKYKKFNRTYMMEGVSQPSDVHMKMLKEKFETTGIKVKIGG